MFLVGRVWTSGLFLFLLGGRGLEPVGRKRGSVSRGRECAVLCGCVDVRV